MNNNTPEPTDYEIRVEAIRQATTYAYSKGIDETETLALAEKFYTFLKSK